jgi:translation initiation factor eIF-2B subunit delta
MARGGNRFDKILEGIKSVEIQGATNVAKAGINAFMLKNDKRSVKKILKARPTEPLLQNAIRLLQKSKNPKKSKERYLSYIKKSQKTIEKKGLRLIRKDMNIFVHCHSSTVIGLLKQAKKKGKNFIVYTTEVEPLLQGRKTAAALSKAKIKVVVFPDMAAEQALRKCDLFLFGADAYSRKGLANKIGTSFLCKIAKEFGIPRYSCGISLKYTKRIKLETRPSSEVWQPSNKTIKIINPAFDFVSKKIITGVLSEFGILPHKQFIKKAKRNLKKLY